MPTSNTLQGLYDNTLQLTKTKQIWNFVTFLQASNEKTDNRHTRVRQLEYYEFADYYVTPLYDKYEFLTKQFSYKNYNCALHRLGKFSPQEIREKWAVKNPLTEHYEDRLTKLHHLALCNPDLKEEKRIKMLAQAEGLLQAKEEIITHPNFVFLQKPIAGMLPS